MHRPTTDGPSRSRLLLRPPALLLVALALVLAPAPASAHEDGESSTAFELVLQALGHLSHGTGHVAREEAMEKLHDALEASDDEGVDLALVEQAEAALEAEDVPRARALLQQSVAAAVTSLPPATGEQTGTTVVLPPLRGRGPLAGGDWSLLTGSAALLLLGLVLAVRFRPRESVHEIQVLLSESAEERP